MENMMEAATTKIEESAIERVKVRVLPDGRVTRRSMSAYSQKRTSAHSCASIRVVR